MTAPGPLRRVAATRHDACNGLEADGRRTRLAAPRLNRTDTPTIPISGTMEYRRVNDRPYSGLMLAARITLPHFSVSSAMSLPKSAGVIGIGKAPRSARR
jgi:hypothetical protein